MYTGTVSIHTICRAGARSQYARTELRRNHQSRVVKQQLVPASTHTARLSERVCTTQSLFLTSVWLVSPVGPRAMDLSDSTQWMLPVSSPVHTHECVWHVSRSCTAEIVTHCWPPVPRLATWEQLCGDWHEQAWPICLCFGAAHLCACACVDVHPIFT